MDATDYFRAIEAGDLEKLRDLIAAAPELLTARASPAYAPEEQETCTGLHAAVYARQLEAARLLVDAGIDVEAKTAEGRSALHDSIEFGCEEITDLLLERGAVVDVCTAAILGKIDRLRELLDADPALANDRSTGLSPLGWSSFGNQVETAGELLDRGARMDDGELLCAASVGHVDVGRLLIRRGADPGELCGEGNALHAAASMRYTEDSRPFIEMLLESGADPTVPSSTGHTAREIAERNQERQAAAREAGEEVWEKRYREVADLLREAEAARGRE